MKQQNHHIITHHNQMKSGGGGGGGKEKEIMSTEMADLKNSYGHKRSILRKLMIAQRQKFMLKKEKAELVKNNLAETSISNLSFDDDDGKSAMGGGGGGGGDVEGKHDNMK